MFDIDRFDSEKFTEGSWVHVSIWDSIKEEYQEADFKIARAGNPLYEKALENSGFRKAKNKQEEHDCLLQAIADGILKDWDGVTAQGEPVPFSRDSAVKAMDANPDLMQRILNEANNLNNYRREDIETQAKKPVNSSGGKGSGAAKDGA